MRLEHGKTCRDEYGNRVGPLKGGMFKWVEGKGRDPDAEWGNDGKVRMRGPEGYGDLIAEWTDGPIRTVTRREVVEGVYAHVAVCPHEPGTVLVGFAHPHDQHFRAMTAPELKAAAAVLLELAGALE